MPLDPALLAPLTRRLVLPALLVLGSAAAPAQTPACEQFIAALGTRINAAGRGLVLEAVPADTPLPAGAKVVGNCSANTYKVLLVAGTAPVAAAKASAPTVPAPAASAPARRTAPAPQALPPAAPPQPAPPVASPVAAAPAVSATPPPEPAPQASAASPAPATRGAGFLARHWPWVATPLALVLVAGLWAWLAHRRAYDAAGLPRGPRLD